ncbi:MAG: hypothetical protein HY741_03600 [Chloroflexi bacterium]|nr:hypothetical protein [Chloroflexota bacterium]
MLSRSVAPPSSPVTRHVVALLAYFLLTLVLTYPLVLHFTTHVAGDGSDDPALAWNLWWVRYALLDLGQSPIYTNYMFFPIGLNLGFYTLTYLNAVLSIPFQFAFGVIPAANVNLILSFALSGFGAYLLVTYLLRRAFVSLRGAIESNSTAEQSVEKNKAQETKQVHSLSLRGSVAMMAMCDELHRLHRTSLATKQSPRASEIASGMIDKQKPFANHARAMTIPVSAFAAGLLYAFSANKFLYASLGQFNIASSQWIPFYILFLLKIFDSPRPPLKYGFLLGFFLLAQALSEFIFASFLILFTIAYLVYWLTTIRFALRDTRANRIRFDAIRALLFAGIVFVLPMSPILAAMLSDTLTEGDFIQQGLGFSNIFSADLLGFFTPSHLHPLFGNLQSLVSFPYINFMYLGFTALALAIVALWKVKPARIWGIWFALVALVTLGPTLRINGAEFDLPLPFDALLEVPFIKGNRYPSRWSVMLTLCLAVMVGYGVAYGMSRIAYRESRIANRAVDKTGVTFYASRLTPSAIGYLLSAIGCALLVFEHLSAPLPISNLQSPEIYSQIAREPGNWTVMEIPLAWRNGFRVTGSYRADSQGPIDRIFMYAQFYQATQQHPILNGNTSRNPELKFQYFSETPVLNSLIAIQEGHEVDEGTRVRDKELAPRVLQFFGTKYVIWHTPYEEANRDVANKTRAYIEEMFPVTKIGESYENGRGTVTYRVNHLPANDTLILKPDDPLARLYLGEGWGAVGAYIFMAQRKEAKIFFPLATPHDLKLTFNRLNVAPSKGRGITFQVNGHIVSRQYVSDTAQFSVVIPSAYVQTGMNELKLQFDTLTREDDSIVSQMLSRGLFSIVVRSAGEEQGAFGHIFVRGKDESPNVRGYNIVVINPEKFGAVEARANFDTFASEQESERMGEFIAQIPDGRIIVVAASDEASFHLTENAVNALKSLGARQDLRGKFRWSHALIANKGNPQSAREAASEIQVSQLIEGAGLIEPTAAASIGEIRIEPAP